MLTKTFRAQNMLTALKNVQDELGADAMIISMREVPAGPLWAAWRKPGVEVIASKGSNPLTKDMLENSAHHSKKIVPPTNEELKREIENLKKLASGQSLDVIPNKVNGDFVKDSKKSSTKVGSIEEEHHFDISDFKALREYKEPEFDKLTSKAEKILSKTDKVVIEKKQESEIPPKLLEIKNKLLNQGINKEIIEKIITTNLDALSPAILNDNLRLERFIKHQLSVYLPPSRKSIALLPTRIMALTGTSGSGKTSCCAKLASFYMITMGKKVVWIEADTVKTSAISEARTYTETLGIPLFLAYTPQELVELIDSQSDADLILIDTASCNPRNEDSVVEVGSYLSTIPTGCSYLVASATTKEQDMIQAQKTLSQFGLKGIILTKTDETGAFGASFNTLWQSKLPLYFFSTGIQIFGNLKPGNPDQLVDAVMAGEFRLE